MVSSKSHLALLLTGMAVFAWSCPLQAQHASRLHHRIALKHAPAPMPPSRPSDFASDFGTEKDHPRVFRSLFGAIRTPSSVSNDINANITTNGKGLITALTVNQLLQEFIVLHNAEGTFDNNGVFTPNNVAAGLGSAGGDVSGSFGSLTVNKIAGLTPAKVATSGSYTDLANTPVLGALASLGSADIGHGGTGATTAVQGLANLGGLPLAGGTMTGALGLGMFQPQITLDDLGYGGNRQILGQSGGKVLWQEILGDQSPRTGSNAGANYGLCRASDAGGFLDCPIAISRSTGVVNFIDGVTGVTAAQVGALPIAGGTMTGPLIQQQGLQQIGSPANNIDLTGGPPYSGAPANGHYMSGGAAKYLANPAGGPFNPSGLSAAQNYDTFTTAGTNMLSEFMFLHSMISSTGYPAAWATGTTYPAFGSVLSNGYIYDNVTGGGKPGVACTSASSGSGPSGTGSSISDGSCTWAWAPNGTPQNGGKILDYSVNYVKDGSNQAWTKVINLVLAGSSQRVNAFAQEVDITNNRLDYGANTYGGFAVGVQVFAGGAHRSTAGIAIGQTAMPTDAASFVDALSIGGTNLASDATILDYSNDPTSFKITSNHAIGIDLSGGTYSGFQIKGGTWNINPSGVGTFPFVQETPITIASLPTCAAGTLGLHAFVSDTTASATATYHGLVQGNGSTTVNSSVSCNGSAWQYE